MVYTVYLISCSSSTTYIQILLYLLSAVVFPGFNKPVYLYLDALVWIRNKCVPARTGPFHRWWLDLTKTLAWLRREFHWSDGNVAHCNEKHLRGLFLWRLQTNGNFLNKRWKFRPERFHLEWLCILRKQVLDIYWCDYWLLMAKGRVIAENCINSSVLGWQGINVAWIFKDLGGRRAKVQWS